MAKAKKSSKSQEVKESAPAAQKPAQPTPPAINPTHSAAAAAAAAMVAAKYTGLTSTETKSESASFQKLKDAASKPHSQISSVLDKMIPGSQKRSSTPFGGGKQVGHNQTFGADASRRSVPRRTGG